MDVPANQTLLAAGRSGQFARAREVAVRAPLRKCRGTSNTPLLFLIIGLAVVATILCYRAFLGRVDDGLRNAVAENLRELFPHASVFVGRVTADGPSKLIVSDVRMALKGVTPKRQVLSAERVVLHGDLDIAHYLQQTVRVEQVHLFGLQIDAWPLDDGSWSLASLKPEPNPDSTPPKMVLNDALVRLWETSAEEDSSAFALHDINGQIEHFRRSAGKVGEVARDAGCFCAHARLSGRSSGLLRNLVVDCQFDPLSQTMQATGAIEDLDFSPKLLEQLPPQLSRYLSQLSGLECRASSTFEITAQPDAPTTFKLQGSLKGGRLQDPRLPYPLENLSSDFFCKNSLLQLRSMRARSGTTQLTLNTDIMGFDLDSPMVIHAEAKNLDLDKRLYQSLPASWQAHWDRMQLAGRVSGTIQLAFDGLRWSPSAEIQCQNVSLTPWLFPFPLTAVKGLVSYRDGTIISQRLDGLAGGQPIHGSFHLSRADSEWYGRLRCRSEGPISINPQLVAALTPVDEPVTGAERFVRSLHPTGAIELTNAYFERPSPNEPTWHRSLDINVYGGSIKYDGFQYPIYDIRGRVVAQDNEWLLDRFEGRNDSGRILCSGSWSSLDDGQVPFELQFQAFDVPVEEELQQALASDAQFIWDELQPSGAVDSVSATIVRPLGSNNVDVRVELTEDSDSNEMTGRSLSLRPKSFPYRLTDVGCKITYEPGFVSIVRASAVNGATRLAVTGECRPHADGRWQANVRWLPTTRVIVDGQLLKALPKSIRESLVKLDFSGPVSIFGRSQMLFANQQHPQPLTTWNCQLDIEGGQLADGKNIGALRGTVWIEGNSDGKEINASGTLGMDALTVRGLPVTGLKGPFALLGSKLYFGSTVFEVLPRVGQPEATSEMTADALSGKLTLSGQGRLDEGNFYLDAQLQHAQLTTLLQDVGVDRASTEAVCNASVQFNGIPWNPQTYVGQGSVRLRDAKLSQLPMMMRLLRTASVNASDDSAFQTADINFQIDGDRIPLQIACEGDVLRLRGDGWTNLRRDVYLELYTYVGRRIPISNVISPLLSESKYATLMMIEVQGTLDNPSMQRRPFPQFEATLQQIFPEVVERR